MKAIALVIISILIVSSVLYISVSQRNRSAINEPTDTGKKNDLAGIEDIINDHSGAVGGNDATPVTPDNTDKKDSEEKIADKKDKNTTKTVTVATVDLKKITNPVKSNKIVMAFSLNTAAVYSKTFNEYRSDHSGVDIAAQVGEDVKAAFDGKVSEVRKDEKLGTTIKLDHGNNIFTEYANLDETVSVKVGDSVKAGAVIAQVGKTAQYEMLEDSHLHFAIIVKGEYKDPALYLSLN